MVIIYLDRYKIKNNYGVIKVEKNEMLKKEYLEKLDQYMKELRDKANKCRTAGSMDEFVLEQIKINVVDIFSKMFKVSYENVYSNPRIEKLKKYIDATPVKHQQLYGAYMHFFEEIPAPWKAKALKDQEFGKDEEYFKETIKLNIAEEIKEIFNENFNKVYGG